MRPQISTQAQAVSEQAHTAAGWKLLSALSYDPAHLVRLGIQESWFPDPQQRTLFRALAAYHEAKPDARMVSAAELARFMAGSVELRHLLRDDDQPSDLCTISLSELTIAFENAYYDNDMAASHARVLQSADFQQRAAEGLAEVAASLESPRQLVDHLQRLTDQLRAEPEVGGAEPRLDLSALPVDQDTLAPRPLASLAFRGPAGEFVRRVLPHSEADPAALLLHFLAYAAAMFGRNRYFIVDAAEHYPTLFAAFVGASSKGRKGTAQRNCEWLFRQVDGPNGTFLQQNVLSGLSSGEGLIHQVRDATLKDDVVVDEGCTDKRRLVVESEFGGTLRIARREGNSLSAVLRDAWDRDQLRVMTRNSPLVATRPHLCIVGHIVREELRRMMGGSDHFNGFANRFLWIYTQRSKLLPNGGQLHREDVSDLVDAVRAAVEFAQIPGPLRRSPAAAARWETAYRELAVDRPGLVGAVTNRAEAQVLRLSMIYALLECREVIEVEHLEAALEIWRYCEDSARYAFGESTGDATADEIRSLLKSAGEAGLSRSALSTAFGRNKTAADLRKALSTLFHAGLAHSRKKGTGGRPVETWYHGPGRNERNEQNERSPSPVTGEGEVTSLISFNSLSASPQETTPGYQVRCPVGRVLNETELDRIEAAFENNAG